MIEILRVKQKTIVFFQKISWLSTHLALLTAKSLVYWSLTAMLILLTLGKWDVFSLNVSIPVYCTYRCTNHCNGNFSNVCYKYSTLSRYMCYTFFINSKALRVRKLWIINVIFFSFHLKISKRSTTLNSHPIPLKKSRRKILKRVSAPPSQIITLFSRSESYSGKTDMSHWF